MPARWDEMSCEALNVPRLAPFTRVVPVGWYDGPTEGVLECDGEPYVFRMAAWDGRQGRRVFVLRPVSRDVFDAVDEIVARPVDDSVMDEQRQAGWDRLMDLLDQGGPVEWLVMADWITGELLQVRPVRDDALRRRIEAMLLPRSDEELDGYSYSNVPHERWLELLRELDPAVE